MKGTLLAILIATTISIKLSGIHNNHLAKIYESHLTAANTHFIDWGHYNSDTAPNPKDLLPSWQSDLDDNLPISKISIPGTHHSGAINDTCISGKQKCTNWKETQTWSIFNQLTAGIRFLQLYVCPGDSAQNIRICHKDAQYQLLSDVMKSVNDFLKKYPKQFVILYFSQQNGKDISDDVLSVVSKSLNSDFVILTKNIPLVKQIRGKAWFWGGKGVTLNSKTFDVTNPLLSSFILQNDKIVKDKAQLVIKTAFGQKCQDFKMKINRLDLSSTDMEPYTYAKTRGQPNDRLDSQLRKQPKGCIGITVMDYPGSNLIKGIVNTNFPKK